MTPQERMANLAKAERQRKSEEPETNNTNKAAQTPPEPKRERRLEDTDTDPENFREKLGAFVVDSFDDVVNVVWEGLKEQGQYRDMATLYINLMSQFLPKQAVSKGGKKKNNDIVSAFAGKLDRLQKGR